MIGSIGRPSADRCEWCDAPIETILVTDDSHPEGPDHLVGECCADRCAVDLSADRERTN